MEKESVQERVKGRERNLCDFLWFLSFLRGLIEDFGEGFDEEKMESGFDFIEEGVRCLFMEKRNRLREGRGREWLGIVRRVKCMCRVG